MDTQTLVAEIERLERDWLAAATEAERIEKAYNAAGKQVARLYRALDTLRTYARARAALAEGVDDSDQVTR